MKPYLFVFKVKPQPDNLQASELGGAHVTVIAFSDSPGKAEKTSINYINEYGWMVEKLAFSSEVTTEHLAQFDELLLSVHRKAELDGISAQFDAWPKEDRPGVYSVEPLRLPRKN